jgi:hypothetical protein
MVISPTLDFSRAISSSRSSRSRSFRAIAAPASARSRHSVSLAIETLVYHLDASRDLSYDSPLSRFEYSDWVCLGYGLNRWIPGFRQEKHLGFRAGIALLKP